MPPSHFFVDFSKKIFSQKCHFRMFLAPLNPNLASVVRFKASVTRYVNFYHENVNISKWHMIFSGLLNSNITPIYSIVSVIALLSRYRQQLPRSKKLLFLTLTDSHMMEGLFRLNARVRGKTIIKAFVKILQGKYCQCDS